MRMLVQVSTDCYLTLRPDGVLMSVFIGNEFNPSEHITKLEDMVDCAFDDVDNAQRNAIASALERAALYARGKQLDMAHDEREGRQPHELN